MLFQTRLLWVVAAIVVPCLVLDAARLYAEPQQERALLIGGGTMMPRAPYRWLDKCNDSLSGSTSRLLEKIFSQLGIDYQYTKPIPYRPEIYDEFHDQLVNGEIDARVIYSIDHSSPDVVYSKQPISSIKLAAFFPTNETNIREPEDLQSRTAVVISPSLRATLYSPVQNYMRQKKRPFLLAKDQATAVSMIESGKADYIFALKYSPILISKNGYDYLDVDETIGQYHLVVRKNSAIAARMPEIDEKLEHAISTGLVDFLEREYLLMWTERRREDCVANVMK